MRKSQTDSCRALHFPITLRGAPRKSRKLASWGVYCKFYLGAPRKSRKLASWGVLLQVLLGGAPRKSRKLASWGVYCKFYLGVLRTSQGNYFSGKFTSSSTCGLRANSGTSRTRLHTATGAAFPAPGRAPINRQSPQRASSRLERGALWRSLAQPCARKPRNVSV